MVRWIFDHIAAPMRELVMRPVRNLHQAAYLLALLTLASQMLALLRDRTFAHTFGAGEMLDLYYAAFRVPDLVFAIVASLVSAYILIPLITNMDRDATKRLLSESASFLLGIGGLICIILAIFMPNFLAFLYPNFITSVHHDEFVLLSRILLLQPILLGLSGILASVTQVHRRFILFALSPVLYNAGIIFGVVVLYPIFGLIGIGMGVLIGSIAYLSVNVPVIVGAGIIPRLKMPSFSLMQHVIRNSVPRSLALGVDSVTALALTAIASRIGTGSISVFTFASNLEAVPLALIGSSYAIAAFPALSEASAPDKRDEFFRILSSSARHIILWSMVSLGLIIVLRAHIVRVVLGTGAFDWDATRLTAALLAVLAIGLVAQGLIILFTRALYAARQSWRPFLYQLVGGTLTVFLAIMLLRLGDTVMLSTLSSLLRVPDVDGTAILLLAISVVIGQIVLVILSLIALRSVVPGLINTLWRPFIDGCVAAFAGGTAAYITLTFVGGIAPLTTLISVFTQGLIAGIVGLTVAGITLFIVENEEFRIVMSALGRLLHYSGKRTDILSPSAQDSIRP